MLSRTGSSPNKKTEDNKFNNSSNTHLVHVGESLFHFAQERAKEKVRRGLERCEQESDSKK